jgi:hypothetical protein
VPASLIMVVAAVCFRSGTMAADLFSPQIRYPLVADVHSMFKLHHGGGSLCWILGLHQVLTPAVEFDGGSGSTSSAIRRFRAATATGRA